MALRSAHSFPVPPAETGALFPPIVDGIAPVITNFSPAIGVEVSASTPVQFDVTDNGTFRRLMILMSMPTDPTETADLVHDGDSFRGEYTAAVNTRVSISGGFRFTVLRAGGWLATPKAEFFVIDTGGNEGVIT